MEPNFSNKLKIKFKDIYMNSNYKKKSNLLI